MSRHWIRMTTSAALLAALTFGIAPVFSQEASAPADAQAEAKADDAIEFDENEPNDEQDEIDAAAKEALSSELGSNADENSADDLLNLAMELKLSASNLLDLSKVIALCQEAEKRGLDDDNLEIAKQLRVSAQLDRGLAIADVFMNSNVPTFQMPNGWEGLADKAIEDLETALAETPDLAVGKLAIGRLYMIRDQRDKAKSAFEAAAQSDDLAPEMKATALKFRAELESDETKTTEYMKSALEINPEDVELRVMMANALLSMRKLDEALAQINLALESDPKNVDAKKAKAHILAEAGKTEEAKAL
ncbi:MAG: tetratricopeptide repeat protein, partial [Thermoguttaceae bacterium]|nr:tetratricopeptide repeat protein [Thermoguttaceae bacterium]